MFQFLGYNYFMDGDALNNAPTSVDNITSTTIENAVFDHFNVTRDTSLTFTTDIPTEWDGYTAMNADFEDNINAGNVDFLVSQIDAIRILRRPVDSQTLNYITLAEIPINTVEDLSFVFNDFLNVNNVEYQYALQPYLIQTGAVGDPYPETILSQFNGVFVGDADSAYKFLYDVNYGTNARNQQVGTFEPLGNKYPVVIANGMLSYDTGTMSATILNDDYEQTGVFDPNAIVAKKEIIKDFLTNKKPKILKDWNGSAWLIFVTDNPQITYKSDSGMRIPNVSFSWTQVGSLDSQSDLYYNGLVDIIG